jgi:hypothetical protein
VDNEVIEIAQAATGGLEPAALPGWVWRRAVSQGFQAMHELAAHGGGYLVADLDGRQLGYQKVLSEVLAPLPDAIIQPRSVPD